MRPVIKVLMRAFLLANAFYVVPIHFPEGGRLIRDWPYFCYHNVSLLKTFKSNLKLIMVINRSRDFVKLTSGGLVLRH